MGRDCDDDIATIKIWAIISFSLVGIAFLMTTCSTLETYMETECVKETKVAHCRTPNKRN